MDCENFLVLSVRGLNSRARRNVLDEVVAQERVSVVCLQETKLHVVDQQLVTSMLGSAFEYDFVPTDVTRGGILVTWRAERWYASLAHQLPHALTRMMSLYASSTPWWLVVVYDPHIDQDKVAFLQELRSTRLGRASPCMFCRDFNLIYKASNKNNAHLNHRLMRGFRTFL
jgi:exonuclease III